MAKEADREILHLDGEPRMGDGVFFTTKDTKEHKGGLFVSPRRAEECGPKIFRERRNIPALGAAMPYDFIQPNDNSRQRLEVLVGSLSEADYREANSSGWTVAALLAHLAFWDQRILALLRRWEARSLDESPVDPDVINDALQPFCLALEPGCA